MTASPSPNPSPTPPSTEPLPALLPPDAGSPAAPLATAAPLTVAVLPRAHVGRRSAKPRVPTSAVASGSSMPGPAQIPAQAPAALPPAPAALAALHRRVQEHLGGVLWDQPCAGYAPLEQRYQNTRWLTGQEGARQQAELHRDLLAIADAPVETLKRMATMLAVTVACMPPTTPHAVAFEALAVANAMRPRPSAAELLRRFAAQGVTITALGDNLHVQPGDRLTEDDRALLRSQKPALLQELGRGGVVL